MPDILLLTLIVVFALVLIFTIIAAFSYDFSDNKKRLILFFGAVIIILFNLIFWLNRPFNPEIKLYYTYELERRGNAVYYQHNNYLINATRQFGRNDLDPEKHVMVVRGPVSFWQNGIYHLLDTHITNTIEEKSKVE